MSALDELKALDKQREQILTKAHNEAKKRADAAIAELNELGFSYRLVEDAQPVRAGGRRTGVRDNVLDIIKQRPGSSPASIREQLNLTDTKGAQSVSNALSALKKAGLIEAKDGAYHPAPAA